MLSQDSNCHIEANANMANDFSVHRIKLLGLRSARHQAVLYSVESTGFPVEAQDFLVLTLPQS